MRHERPGLVGSQDPNIRRPSKVESVPSGEGQVTTASSIIYPESDPDPLHVPKGNVCFAVTTFPEDEQLNLWNQLWNIYIDTDDSAYDWFGGPLLSDDQRHKIIVTDCDNWASSSDQINRRVKSVKVINQDSVAHTVSSSCWT